MQPFISLTLETVFEIVLAGLIVFCFWQQWQLRNTRADCNKIIAKSNAQEEEIHKLEAQIDILVQLQNPDIQPFPNAIGALYQKLVALRQIKTAVA